MMQGACVICAGFSVLMHRCPPSPLSSLGAWVQVKDLGQQVARLVHEVQLLQSGLPPEAAGATSPGAAFAGGNASDVTTQRLVEFKDIEVGGSAAVMMWEVPLLDVAPCGRAG